MEKVRQKDYQNKGNDYQIKEMIVVPCYFTHFPMLKGSNPLAWSHAGYGLEVTEKRRLGAEARRRSDCHYLHVWLLA